MLHLHPAFRVKLERLLETLQRAGVPFRLDEGFRSAERQAWLYGSGRLRPGATLTQKDGQPGLWPPTHDVVSERGKPRRSRHQSGLAADLYPVRGDGRVWIPPASHEVWVLLATAARALGLRAGRDWGDSPHVEWAGALPKEPKEAA
jgi:hypothetical protein